MFGDTIYIFFSHALRVLVTLSNFIQIIIERLVKPSRYLLLINVPYNLLSSRKSFISNKLFAECAVVKFCIRVHTVNQTTVPEKAV